MGPVYQVNGAYYKPLHGKFFKGRPIYEGPKKQRMVQSASRTNLVALVDKNGSEEENKDAGCVNISMAVKFELGDTKNDEKSTVQKLGKALTLPSIKKVIQSACGRCWAAISLGEGALKGIVSLGFIGALWTSTAAVCSMAYAKRTIVHFVPAVVNTMVNGTVTTVPNPFNATAFNATCVNDTAKNAADQYCVYEDRVGSLPHAIAAVIMLVFSIGLTKRAIAGIR